MRIHAKPPQSTSNILQDCDYLTEPFKAMTIFDDLARQWP